MRKPHRKQLLACLLTVALLLTNLPVSVLSEEIIEKSIQTEATEQNEQKTVEDPNLPDFLTEETGEPIEPPVSEELNETPEPSNSDIEETPSPEVPEEMPDTGSTDEPPAEKVPAEESPLPDDEEAFSVSEALSEYGYAYAARMPFHWMSIINSKISRFRLVLLPAFRI